MEREREREREREIAKEKFYAANIRIKICDVDADDIVILQLVKTKPILSILLDDSNKAIRLLNLIMPKMSGYVKTFNGEYGDICAKIEELK